MLGVGGWGWGVCVNIREAQIEIKKHLKKKQLHHVGVGESSVNPHQGVFTPP